MRKFTALIVLTLAVVVIGSYAINKLRPKYTVTVPDYSEPKQLVELSQGWSDVQRSQYHHTPQGSKLLPYAWFVVLEQPCFNLTACEKFSDPKYLSRFGFLAGKQDAKLNPAGLPVGFAYQENFHDPITNMDYPAVGLTCSACHTGELHYGQYAVRVEGAPAMIEVAQFQKALGLALGFTQKIPFRYGRFERNVLGPNATEEEKVKFKQSFTEFMKKAMAEKDATEEAYVNQAGFSRTDALTRIGNQVFAVDMNYFGKENLSTSSAPVRFPQIWDAPWFNWVQYNSSIADPMARNIGEALGVRAVAKLYGPNAADFENSVNMEGLEAVEQLLRGPGPFEGLSSPKWPAVFPALDKAKVTKGAELYQQHCVGCHLPNIPELVADLHSAQPHHWWKNGVGKSFVKVIETPVDKIGTDPHEAQDFITRTADTRDLKKGVVSAAAGLDLITREIGNRYYDKMGFPPEKRLEWNGFHDPSEVSVRAPAVYKARPLNGIWAVAPYLHNGSVPNLYALLSPQTERPSTFWLGSKEFDPVKVGYDFSELKGGYLFKTDVPGNANSGHEFKDGPKGKGVIGPSLSPDDRWALIEYMKSM